MLREPVPVLLLAAPVLSFYGLLFARLRNVPIFDDYHALLEFACTYVSTPGAFAKLALIASAQHGLYKLVFEHALVGLELSSTGHIHFALLAALGNLAVLGTGLFLWLGFLPRKTPSARIALFVPVACLLFQLNYTETLDWAMCSLQGVACVFFAVASFSCVTRKTPRMFALACLFQFLAALSSANGLLVVLPGVLYVFKNRWRLLAWLSVFACALCVYLYRYQPFLNQPKHDVALPGICLAAVSFFGAAAENMHRKPIPYASFALGCVLLMSLAWALAHRMGQTCPMVTCIAVWCVVTVLPVCVFRVEPTLTAELSGRYKIYSDLLLICAYTFYAGFLRLEERPRMLLAVVAGCMLFSAASDVLGWRFLVRRDAALVGGMRRYRADPQRNSPIVSDTGDFFAGDIPERARQTLQTADSLGIYHASAALP